MCFLLRGAGERLQVAGIGRARQGVALREALKYLIRCFLYASIGRWKRRIAFEASLVSRKRFGTHVMAPKMSSERIVSSGRSKELASFVD